MNPALPDNKVSPASRKSWVNPALPDNKVSPASRKSWVNPALPKEKMDGEWYYVYLLSSRKTKWIYIGCTRNLEYRIKEHMDGMVYSTKSMLPIDLIYYEAYRYKETAYRREKSLKAYGSGLAKLKLRIGLKHEGRAG